MKTRETSLEQDLIEEESTRRSALGGIETHAAPTVRPNFSNFRVRRLPGQENTIRARYSSIIENGRTEGQAERELQAIEVARLLIKA